MNQTYRVGMYCRLSVDDASNPTKSGNYIPAEDSVSIENQKLLLQRYVRERVYPFPGETVRAVLRCEEDLLSDVLDRFGMETQLRDNGDGTFDATVFTGAAGLKFWALQYVTVCQVLEPLGLRREIGETLRTGWENYQRRIGF